MVAVVQKTLQSKRRLLLVMAAAFVGCELLLAGRQYAWSERTLRTPARGASETSSSADGVKGQEEKEKATSPSSWRGLWEDAAKAVESWMVIADSGQTSSQDDPEETNAVDKGEAVEAAEKTHEALRDVFYPAEAKIRVFNLYEEDYVDQEELDEVERIVEGGQ